MLRSKYLHRSRAWCQYRFCVFTGYWTHAAAVEQTHAFREASGVITALQDA